MKPLENNFLKNDLFKYREEVLKKQKMGKLEKQIDKFLQESGVRYHRQFPIRIGRKHPKRYVASFWLQDKEIILDICATGDDMSVYDVGRHVNILFHSRANVKFIAAINEDMKWREVKKQLQAILAMP